MGVGRGVLQPVLAGVVTAVVGFASTFAVVLAGLRAVGADSRQAASGLLAVCVAAGATAIVLGLRHRVPISIAWSTPGAALLAATGTVDGGFAAAVGAFLVTGALIVAAGLFPALGRAIAAIPRPIAAAMLAGVLLDLCIAPVRALVDVPLLAAPIVLVWLLLNRFARAWAVPAALIAAVLVIVLDSPAALRGSAAAPEVVLTAPVFTWQALVSLAVPLFLVTMASQNVPGMAVLQGYGYTPPLRGVLLGTGAATAVAAPFGSHAVNLAAITAALAAGPDAHPDPRRRWIASVTAGAGMIALGLGASAATAFVLSSPPLLIEAVAGLALLGALGAAIASATAEAQGREAAVVTFVVTASGVALLGVGAAFWGLLAGGLMLALRPRSGTTPPSPRTSADRPPTESDPTPAEPSAVPS